MIYAAGWATVAGVADFAVAKYNADGSLNTRFGQGGLVTTDFEGMRSVVYAMAFQGDAKLILAGYYGIGGGYSKRSSRSTTTNRAFALARYNTDGSLDSSFGSGGLVDTAIRSDSVIYAAAVQPDGKIVVAGTSIEGTNYQFALARYLPDGSLDGSFGTGGIVLTQVGTGREIAEGLAIYPKSGKIVVVGSARTGDKTAEDISLVRYNPDGSLDPSFGQGGIVRTDFTHHADVGRAIAIQGDGKIVVDGYAWNTAGTKQNFALARYDRSGALDPTFGSNGKVMTRVGPDQDWAMGLALQSDGKILATGRSWNGANFDFALARYTTSGQLDQTFGERQTGIVRTSFGDGDEEGRGVAVQSDGKIVVAGIAHLTSSDIAVARYLGDG